MVKTNGILHTSIPYPSLKAFGISFFRIFNAPLRSALINLPVIVLNNPLLIQKINYLFVPTISSCPTYGRISYSQR